MRALAYRRTGTAASGVPLLLLTGVLSGTRPGMGMPGPLSFTSKGVDMGTHPPLFTAMCRRLSPRHPVNVLARSIAFHEDHILTPVTRHVYYPRGWDQPHERDMT